MLKMSQLLATQSIDHMVLVDVGSAGGPTDLASAADITTVVTFDPRPESEDSTTATPQFTRSHYKEVITMGMALSSKTEQRELFVTRIPEGSSLLRPDAAVIGRVRSDNALDHAATLLVDCRSLDDVLDGLAIGNVDELKIDTQGSELLILQGATRWLPRIGVIRCEVEFIPLYVGQPLFDEVVAFLSSHGFRFLAFTDGRNLGGHYGIPKQVWGDAVFVRDSHDRSDATVLRQAVALADSGLWEDAIWLLDNHSDNSRRVLPQFSAALISGERGSGLAAQLVSIGDAIVDQLARHTGSGMKSRLVSAFSKSSAGRALLGRRMLRSSQRGAKKA